MKQFKEFVTEKMNPLYTQEIVSFIHDTHKPDLEKLLKAIVESIEQKFSEELKGMNKASRNDCIARAIYVEISELK